MPGGKYRSNARHGKKGCADQQAPGPPLEGAPSSPIFHAVAGIVIADNMFLRVIVFAHNGQLLHVEAAALKFLHGFLGCRVVLVYGYNCVAFSHDSHPSAPTGRIKKQKEYSRERCE